MNYLLPLLITGAVTFVQQDFTLHGSNELPSPARELRSILHADLDGDGKLDLITSYGVWFQRDGGFGDDARADLPGGGEWALLDCSEDTLFLRYPDRLALYQWRDGGWKTVLDQPIEWPQPALEHQYQYWYTERYDGEPFPVTMQFLMDINGDGVPEIVAPGSDGLHVYQLVDGVYQDTAILDVYPPMRPGQGWSARLWHPDSPRTERSLVFQLESRRFDYAIDRDQLTVVKREIVSSHQLRFHTRHYKIVTEQGFEAVLKEDLSEVSELFPIRTGYQYSNSPFMSLWRPRRLNDEGPLAYTLANWEYSYATAMPIPIFQTSVSMDGGKSVDTVRSQHLSAPVSFVDFNGNGRVDRVVWSAPLFSAGVREAVNFTLTGNRGIEEVQVHFQDEHGRFSNQPDVTGRFTLHFERPPIRGSRMYSTYAQGRAFQLNGDFTGNGLLDMAVMERIDRIGVYPCEGREFASSPVATLPVPDDWLAWTVRDMNGNGRPDIILQYHDGDSDAPTYSLRVFYAREVIQ